jgi:SAM-dependent methyltransferase
VVPEHDDINLAEMFSQGFWDERYGAHASLWSGNPNGNLVAEVSGLSPGTALDVGCGEGADAIWLARQGWTVTGVDISTVALKRAAAHAAEAGPEVASRTSWEHVDIFEWDPGAERYDLVSAQYLHPPAGRREALFRHLAAAVRPGGTLLIVGHHPSDLETTVPRPPLPELFFTGDDVVALLNPGDWDVVTNAARERSAVDPEGRTVTIHDAVLRAQRHG